jgi:PAS domain S-box-containing protein
MSEPVEALKYVSDGVATLDGEWRFTYVNNRAALLFRRRDEELMGRTLWEVFPDLAATPSAEELRAAAGSTVPRRVRVFHPQLYAWHEVQAVPSGEGLLLVIRDVSDEARMQQTEAVRSAVREIFEQIPMAVSLLRGPEHQVEIMNAAARQLLGGRDMEGRSVRSALPELEGQGLFELLDEVYSTGKPFEGKEVPVRFDRHGDGTLNDACFNILYQPLFDITGRVSGVLSISVEVTDLVRQRGDVERRAAEQLAVLGQLAEGVVITDAVGRITFVNEAAERLHGVALLDVAPAEYAAAYGLLTVEGAPFAPEELPLARAVLRAEEVTGARWRIRRPDGSEVEVEGNARPVFVSDGAKVAAVLTLREVGSGGRTPP